uniref:Uncharacterized protein n=1 Tax=Manihot esculenta TaxID=3983 RepID=A0A2C9UPN8_MANES
MNLFVFRLLFLLLDIFMLSCISFLSSFAEPISIAFCLF